MGEVFAQPDGSGGGEQVAVAQPPGGDLVDQDGQERLPGLSAVGHPFVDPAPRQMGAADFGLAHRAGSDPRSP
jgi:hypothetical protein